MIETNIFLNFLPAALKEEKPYVLTELGQQFVHYAMSELPPKIEYQPTADSDTSDDSS